MWREHLLGCTLIRRTPEGPLVGTIVEAEAYLTGDPASHGYRGESPRNASMFGPPGHAYVYLSYGMHFMLNLVTQTEGVGEAVLLRAAWPLAGLPVMRANRNLPVDAPARTVASGPGKLAQAFAITRSVFDTADLTDPSGSLVVTAGEQVSDLEIIQTTRIGITHGADSPWRFYVKGHPGVSKR